MKSKQEVIQEAYDNTFPDSSNYNFDKIRSAVDENGWYRFNNNLTVNICTTGFDHDKGAYRPKSLRGIENNRGWTTIKSEEDLPKENGDYFVVWKAGEDVIISAVSYDIDNPEHWNGVTHYQPIIKPEAPLH